MFGKVESQSSLTSESTDLNWCSDSRCYPGYEFIIFFSLVVLRNHKAILPTSVSVLCVAFFCTIFKLFENKTNLDNLTTKLVRIYLI